MIYYRTPFACHEPANYIIGGHFKKEKAAMNPHKCYAFRDFILLEESKILR